MDLIGAKITQGSKGTNDVGKGVLAAQFVEMNRAVGLPMGLPFSLAQELKGSEDSPDDRIRQP
jgi:hypothetical protein